MNKQKPPFRRIYAAIALFTALVLSGCSSVSEAPLPSASQTPQAAAATAPPITVLAGSITMDSAGIDEADAYTDWQSGAYTEIALSATGYTISGQGAAAEDTVLTISSAGTYVLSGTMPNGAVVVDAEDTGDVRIVFNSASIACSDGAPLFVKNADRVILSLAPGTENSLEDGASYTYALYDTGEDEPSAALFSKDDLILNGAGALNITANHNDGVTSNDDLKIIEGTLTITAVDDGIVGKDMVAVKTADITISAGGDGIKSTNDTDAGKGFIAIESGTFVISAGADGIQAETELFVADGDFKITSGGGADSENTPQQMQGPGQGGMRPVQGGKFPQPPQGADSETAQGQMPQAPNDMQGGQQPPQPAQNGSTTAPAAPAEDTEASSGSYKALKASTFLTIKNGTFDIDSADDALHTNGSMAISDGALSIASGDDGLHADQSIAISGGTLTISKSVEGIEGFAIEISDGMLNITASDDGINVAGGNDSSGVQNGRDRFANLEGASFTISGGDITISAFGDGLDSNGSGYITGGTVFISGPENNGNGALDYNGEFLITGGTLVALGSAGMAVAPTDGTTQLTIVGNLPASQAADSTLTLKNANGEIIVTHPSAKTYQNVVISTPMLESGQSYTLLVDGNAVQEVTLSDTVTTFNMEGGRGGFGGGKGGMGQPPGGNR